MQKISGQNSHASQTLRNSLSFTTYSFWTCLQVTALSLSLWLFSSSRSFCCHHPLPTVWKSVHTKSVTNSTIYLSKFSSLAHRNCTNYVRNTFPAQGHHLSMAMHVGYNISYKYSASFSYNGTCPCDGNPVKSPLLPIKHSKCIPWNSSAILAYTDQNNLLFQNAGAGAANLSDCRNQYHQVSSIHVHLQLSLHLHEDLPCLPSVEQVSAVLEDLTSWVMLYLAANSN